MVRWLRLHIFNAGGKALIPGWGTKIPHAMWCNWKKENSSPEDQHMGQRFQEVETRKGRGRKSAPCGLQEGGHFQTLSVGFPGDWLSSHQCDKPLLCPVAAGLTPASPWVWEKQQHCPVGWRGWAFLRALRSQGAGHPGWWEGSE